MSRLAPKMDVLRALFARSGNQCAFPGCTQPLINNKNEFIGQVCHIEAAMPGGPRYNMNSCDEHRRSYTNLMLLCYQHHIETDDDDVYSVDNLKEMKYAHEKLFEKTDFKIDEAELYKLSSEMDRYWDNIEILNKFGHMGSGSGLQIEINAKATFFNILEELYESIDGIQNLLKLLRKSDDNLVHDFYSLLDKKGLPKTIFEDILYYENPFENRNWEFHYIGVPNIILMLRINILNIEIKYLEEYLKTNRNDLLAKDRLDKAKLKFKDFAQTAIYTD